MNNNVSRPDIYKRFEGKTKYSEWEFVYGQTAPAGTITGLGNPLTGGTGGNPATTPPTGPSGPSWRTGSGSTSPYSQ
jgi:hypothetical protein